MSLPAFSTQAELFSTAGLSGQLFEAKDRYRLFAQKIYPVLAKLRSELETCYCTDNGRVAVEPVLLTGVSLLQYLDGVPDRQALDLLRYHAGWNFALNRQLGDEVFHPTTLVNFRQRLLDHHLSAALFQAVLEALLEAGLLARKGRQRLDSTQMFGRVSRMSRLDCVRESLRLALQELSQKLAPAQPPPWWTRLWERYVETQTDYRAGEETLARKFIEAGTDAKELLDWLASDSGQPFRQIKQVELLGRVFAQQFEVSTETAAPAAKSKEQLGSDRVQNPHEPEATYSCKGRGEQKKEHVGYKVQVAESVSQAVLAPAEPTQNFIVGVVTHAAPESDEQGAAKMAAEQQAMGLDKPSEQYVDAAYISAKDLAQAAQEQRELIGPAPAPANNNEGRFNSETFQVKVEERQALCPAGHQNSLCSRLEEKTTGKVSYRFEWESAVCATCPLRAQCIRSTDKHRTLVVGEHHTFLQGRRQEQKTPAFKERMRHRNAIEGTQSELARAHGLKRCRYRGLAKARLQNYFAAAACNSKRWLRRLAWEIAQSGLQNDLSLAKATF
jgi:transposase